MTMEMEIELYVINKCQYCGSPSKRTFCDNQCGITKASFILFSLLIILNVILIFSSSIIIRVLFGSQYLPSVKFVRLLLIAYIPFTLYQPFRYLTYTFNKTIILFLVPFLQSFLLILVGPYFILGLGTHGIILAKAIMFIIGFIIFFVSVFREKVSNDR